MNKATGVITAAPYHQQYIFILIAACEAIMLCESPEIFVKEESEKECSQTLYWKQLSSPELWSSVWM